MGAAADLKLQIDKGEFDILVLCGNALDIEANGAESCCQNGDHAAAIFNLYSETDRIISLHWDEVVERNYPVGLRVQVENRRGMIAVLATRLSAIGLNIERIATQNKDVEFTFVDLELQVSSRTHLAHVMKRLRSVEGVLRVVRSARR